MEVGLHCNAHFGRHAFFSNLATIAIFVAVFVDAVTNVKGYPTRTLGPSPLSTPLLVDEYEGVPPILSLRLDDLLDTYRRRSHSTRGRDLRAESLVESEDSTLESLRAELDRQAGEIGELTGKIFSDNEEIVDLRVVVCRLQRALCDSRGSPCLPCPWKDLPTDAPPSTTSTTSTATTTADITTTPAVTTTTTSSTTKAEPVSTTLVPVTTATPAATTTTTPARMTTTSPSAPSDTTTAASMTTTMTAATTTSEQGTTTSEVVTTSKAATTTGSSPPTTAGPTTTTTEGPTTNPATTTTAVPSTPTVSPTTTAAPSTTATDAGTTTTTPTLSTTAAPTTDPTTTTSITTPTTTTATITTTTTAKPTPDPEAKCDDPKPPDNGYIVGNETKLGSHVEIKCKAGFTLVGVPMMECTALWSDETHSFSYNWAPPMSAVCKANAGYVAPTPTKQPKTGAKDGKAKKIKPKRRKRSAKLFAVEEVICNLPQKVGPCRASFRRYFFNVESGLCEPFTFGGCQGNANNFRTSEECAQKCSIN